MLPPYNIAVIFDSNNKHVQPYVLGPCAVITSLRMRNKWSGDYEHAPNFGYGCVGGFPEPSGTRRLWGREWIVLNFEAHA